MVVNGHAGETQCEVAQCDAVMCNDAALHSDAVPHDCTTLRGDTVLCDVAFLEHDRAASYDDYIPYPAYPIDDIPLVPEALEVAMQQGYRLRCKALNEGQRRAFRLLVEMACAVTPSTTMPGIDRSDAYVAWCALERDFPEIYWMSYIRLYAVAEGTIAHATYQEPFARRGRPYLLFDLSLHAAITDVVLASLFSSPEEGVRDAGQGDMPSDVWGGTPNDVWGDAQSGAQSVTYAQLSVEERVRRIRLLRGSVILRGNLPRVCYESARECDRVLSEWTALDMKYLCDRCGVECQVVWGTRRGFSHAWNMVRVDGRWLHVDAFADRELAEGHLIEHDDPDGGQSILLEDSSLFASDLAALGERVPDVRVYLLRTNEEMSVTYDWSLAGLLPYL